MCFHLFKFCFLLFCFFYTVYTAVQIELTNHNNSSNAEETEYANTEAFSASFEPIPVTEFRSHIMQLTQTNGYPKEYQVGGNVLPCS